KPEYGEWLRAKPQRILGANFNPPNRRGHSSSSSGKTSPQNLKEEKTADTTVPVPSPCDDQETNKENGVANVLVDDITVPQEEISPTEIHELELNNLAAAESSPLMVPTTTPPTPILTSSEDIIMIPISAYVKKPTLPSQMSSGLKRCHDEYEDTPILIWISKLCELQKFSSKASKPVMLKTWRRLQCSPASPNEYLKLEMSRHGLALDSSTVEGAHRAAITLFCLFV
ncbi:hypothetical protein M569_11709, partial [Genlisea aurea]